ncbi:hypothetical protein Tco_0942042 [Tanacetum coccineum]|uniref:Integrase, catalytic region, zinc finger, CCHC-type, peptidase aspartic, catalytic n=1 Tax=Tanacetum coccineum TaxID=301880 RepID=A0ABQ5DSL5_9ASTR
MANLSEDIQCAGSDTRPPMLDMTDFASWKQHIQLYCRGKENGVNILKSIDDGPFQMAHFGKHLLKGMKATNILLQGLPKDIYTLINHYTDAKYIWDNVKMLLEGETIHYYYVRFTKLINDMRNIKMTMPKMQLNLKFVNNMLSEWGRFVTVVKLNKCFKESNYDQLYAYLKQHEAHANENKMMLERFTQHTVDPLALMSNVSPHQYSSQSSTTPSSTHVPPGQQNKGQGNNPRGAGAAGNGGAQNRVGNANPGQAKQIKCYKCNVLDEEQLLFLAGGHDTAVDKDVDESSVQDLALNVDNVFQADDCDAFDSDVDKDPNAQTMFMANLSSADPVYDEADPSYDSNILSEVHEYNNYQDAVCEHYDAHEMHHDVQPNCIVDSNADYMSDSNMILYDKYVKDNAEPVVQSNVSSMPNDAYMMIINDMHKQTAQSVSANEQNKVVNASLTAELATYKEQVELYKRRAKFELTKREQNIEE